jgi:hypothetical protein
LNIKINNIQVISTNVLASSNSLLIREPLSAEDQLYDEIEVSDGLFSRGSLTLTLKNAKDISFYLIFLYFVLGQHIGTDSVYKDHDTQPDETASYFRHM